MGGEDSFRAALADKKVPMLVLDPRWHRLFAIHGKTDEIRQLEKQENELFAEQGRRNTELKDLRKLKATLMDSIVRNMEGTSEDKADSIESRKLAENRRLIDEINEKLEIHQERLLELPHLLKNKNEDLMIASMEYCYEKMRVNEQEAEEIAEWIRQIRIELKKNILRKQSCEINSREIYAYMHDIFGPQVIDLFDIEYEYIEDEEETENGGGDTPPQEQK